MATNIEVTSLKLSVATDKFINWRSVLEINWKIENFFSEDQRTFLLSPEILLPEGVVWQIGIRKTQVFQSMKIFEIFIRSKSGNLDIFCDCVCGSQNFRVFRCISTGDNTITQEKHTAEKEYCATLNIYGFKKEVVSSKEISNQNQMNEFKEVISVKQISNKDQMYDFQKEGILPKEISNQNQLYKFKNEVISNQNKMYEFKNEVISNQNQMHEFNKNISSKEISNQNQIYGYNKDIVSSEETANQNQIDSIFHVYKLFVDKIKVMWYSKTTMDCRIQIGSDFIHAHKFVLLVMSPVLASMLQPTTGKALDTIIISDISFKVMMQVVRFMYGIFPDYKALMNNLYEFYYASVVYQVSGLRDQCISAMIQNLNIENASGSLYFSYHCQDGDLLAEVVEFCRKNFKRIVKTAGWKFYIEKNRRMASLLIKYCAMGSQMTTSTLMKFMLTK